MTTGPSNVQARLTPLEEWEEPKEECQSNLARPIDRFRYCSTAYGY